MNSEKFIHCDLHGFPCATLSVSEMEDGVSVLKYKKSEESSNVSFDDWLKLFNQGVLAAKKHKSKKLICRLKSNFELEMFKTILHQLNFQFKSKRVEYQLDVEKLPLESGSPFVWKSLTELKWSIKELVDFIKIITTDALDVEDDDDPNEFVKDILYNDELTHGSDCIHIGFLNESLPAAFVAAQIEKSSGWSRLSYVGLAPAFRQKKLGRWVHLHGFEMIKSQGGILYHGGTLKNNLPMRKLFLNHQCQLFCEMEEWHLRLSSEV